MKFAWLQLTALFLCFCIISTIYGAPNFDGADHPTNAETTDTAPHFTIVLDAGHGGEDGGAVSATGICEKNINLAIAKKLEALLSGCGVSVVMTRNDDTLLYDKTVDYHGRKKSLDLAARREIAEKTENAIFVSIHLNAFPSAKYSGLQVWYSPNSSHSLTLAQSVQALTAQQLQPQNDRRVKSATSSIYLLHHLNCPAILVECGFLSNPTEAELLASEEYQNRLAFLLFLALTDGMTKISSEFPSTP